MYGSVFSEDVDRTSEDFPQNAKGLNRISPCPPTTGPNLKDRAMLDHIKIEGYKSIKHLDLDLKPISILIGANGAGKTNFISFFKLVNKIYEQQLRRYTMENNADRLLFYGRKKTERIKGSLKFSKNEYSFILLPSADGTMFLEEESSLYDDGKPFVKYSRQESFLREDASMGRSKYLKEYLESYKIYHFHDTSVESPLRSKPKISDAIALHAKGGNLPAILYFLQEKYPKTLRRIELVVKDAVPRFDRFLLIPDWQEEGYIALRWCEVNNTEKPFDANDLSDGSIRFIALATLLMQPTLPKIIIIDEPELGLHPVAIYKLAGMIRSAAARGCQIIISTQSVDLVNNFAPENIITVDRKEDGQSIFRWVEPEKFQEWLEDYSPGELWAKSVLDGQPTVIDGQSRES